MRKKAQEELREETELKSMEKQDHPAPAPQPILASSSAAPFSAADAPAGEEELDMSFLEDMVPQEDLGNEQPQTPPMTTMAIPPSPRASPTSRAHDEGPEEEDHSSKKAKVESSKKQRIEVVKETYARMIRAVKVGTDEYYTMDSYDTDYSWENEELVDDVWMDEDSLQLIECQKNFGQMPRQTRLQDHQNNGLTRWLIRLRFPGCLTWAFYKSVMIFMKR